MSGENEYQVYRDIYIKNIIQREDPILPAYYFYCQHYPNADLLSSHEFANLFIQGITEGVNLISMEFQEAMMDIEEINRILVKYYDICFLFNKENELVKIY